MRYIELLILFVLWKNVGSHIRAWLERYWSCAATVCLSAAPNLSWAGVAVLKEVINAAQCALPSVDAARVVGYSVMFCPLKPRRAAEYLCEAVTST